MKIGSHAPHAAGHPGPKNWAKLALEGYSDPRADIYIGPTCGPVTREPDWAGSLIRHCPDPQARERLLEALSYFPKQVLERVAAYGTRIEVFDSGSQHLPLYARNLSKPKVAGSYSPRANVLSLPSHNLTPLVLFHELAHALDLSLGETSLNEEWQKAHAQASATRQVVRAYATKNVSEYFAENVAAYLIPDAKLKDWMARTQPHSDLSLAEWQRERAHYSHLALAKVDPTAWNLVHQLLERLSTAPPVIARPALTEAEYRAEMQQLLEQKRRNAVPVVLTQGLASEKVGEALQ